MLQKFNYKAIKLLYFGFMEKNSNCICRSLITNDDVNYVRIFSYMVVSYEYLHTYNLPTNTQYAIRKQFEFSQINH